MSNKIFGGSYTCSECGKYHRTTTVCNCGDRKKLPEKKSDKTPKKVPSWEEMETSGLYDDYETMGRAYATMHVEQAVIAIINSVDFSDESYHSLQEGSTISIDEETIINAYPLSNIN